MPRKCPDCKSEMEDDGVHCWCNEFGCTFEGYVKLATGKILRDEPVWLPGVECEHGYDCCPMCDGTGQVQHEE